MEVDSDVQEIFAWHQMHNEDNNNVEPEVAAQAASKVASQGRGEGTKVSPTESQQDAMRKLLSQQAPHDSHDAKPKALPLSQTLQHQQQPDLPLSAPNDIQSQIAALVRDRLAQQQQQQQQQISMIPGSSSAAQGPSNINTLGSLANQHTALAASLGGNGSEGNGIKTSGVLLLQLLDVSQQYLDSSSGDNSPNVASIRNLLELLLVLGRKELLRQREQEDQRNAQVASVQRLLVQMQQASRSHQLQQQQTPQQQFASLQQANQGSNLMEQLLLQQAQQQQLQQALRQQRQDSSNRDLLQQLLQGTAQDQGPVGQNQGMSQVAQLLQQQQQQRQVQQQQQQNQGDGSNGGPNVSALLQLLRQQQQNNNSS